MGAKRPVVGIPCDVKMISGLPFHAVGEKYITAVRDVVGATPVLLPVPHEPVDPETVFDLVDGLLLTGSHSNVHPARYAGPDPGPAMALDPQRDQTTLTLIPAAIERGVPVFGICRGLQEINVALGGTIDPALHERPGRTDHREDPAAAEAVRYGPAHQVRVTEGGLLHRLTGRPAFEVNSLHGQGIARLAPPARIEAVADDGTIEAISVPGAAGFILAVQWHPEWRAAENPVSKDMFAGFRAALDARANLAK